MQLSFQFHALKRQLEQLFQCLHMQGRECSSFSATLYVAQKWLAGRCNAKEVGCVKQFGLLAEICAGWLYVKILRKHERL